MLAEFSESFRKKHQADLNELKQRCKKGWIKTLHNDVRESQSV